MGRHATGGGTEVWAELGALVLVHNVARARGPHMTAISANAKIRQEFALTALDTVFGLT